MTTRADASERADDDRVLFNTHLHVAPNFSAFTTPEDAVHAAAQEGIRVLGVSNFHDRRVYGRFGDAARRAGILPLFGSEYITVVEPLRAKGERINDPANPGRMYLCGKGIDPVREPSPEARRIDDEARTANEARARTMVSLLRRRFTEAGLATALDDAAVIEDVADRAGVPPSWVVLQERHMAMAFQEALFLHVAPADRPATLAAIFGTASSVDVEDPVAVQGEIRSRLMKAGGAAFVEESALSFDDAVALVLDLDGIPTYPTLADGASPVCEFEADPDELAAALVRMNIHMAELIPNRNDPAVVSRYVRAFRSAGIVVTAGTEHNTLDAIPVAPACRGGAPLPPEAVRVFWEGAYVIAAHQHQVALGQPGFVDAAGNLTGTDVESRIRELAALGSRLVHAGKEGQ